MSLISFYKQVLESLSVKSDSLGLLTHHRIDGQVEPVRVRIKEHTKRLTLPLPELLSSGIPDELVAFHPLSEISNRGESEVFKKLKGLVNLRISTTLMSLMEDLTELAADKEKHSTLQPRLHPLLEAMPTADAKLVENLSAIIGAAVSGGKNRLFSIYINRGGTHKGTKHARVAVVSFPILEELSNPDRKVFGIQLRVKDVTQIRALFELLIPNSDVIGFYNASSDSMDYPYFEALLQAYANVARALNNALKMAGKHVEDNAYLKIDTSWSDELSGLEQYRFEIPALEGNKGASLKNDGSEDHTSVIETRPSVDASANELPENNSVRKIPTLPEAAVSFKTDFNSTKLRENMQNMNRGASGVTGSPNGTAFQKIGKPADEPVYQHSGSSIAEIRNRAALRQPAPMYQHMPQQPMVGYMAAPMPGYPGIPQVHGYPQPSGPVSMDPFAMINNGALYQNQVIPSSRWGSGWASMT